MILSSAMVFGRVQNIGLHPCGMMCRAGCSPVVFFYLMEWWCISLFGACQAVVQLRLWLLELVVEQGDLVFILAQEVERFFAILRYALPYRGVVVFRYAAQCHSLACVGKRFVLAVLCLLVCEGKCECAVSAMLAAVYGENILYSRPDAAGRSPS